MKKSVIILLAFIVLISAAGWYYFSNRNTVTQSISAAYTADQVASHNNASDCWSSINGNVYNLSAWVNIHPGGADKILSICGKDGSSSFNAQHGNQRKPARELSSFLIGTVK